MELVSQLKQSIISERFPVAEARRLTSLDWREMIKPLGVSIRREAESLFYFMEGFVEEVDEGFVDGCDDQELYRRSIALIQRLEDLL